MKQIIKRQFKNNRLYHSRFLLNDRLIVDNYFDYSKKRVYVTIVDSLTLIAVNEFIRPIDWPVATTSNNI